MGTSTGHPDLLLGCVITYLPRVHACSRGSDRFVCLSVRQSVHGVSAMKAVLKARSRSHTQVFVAASDEKLGVGLGMRLGLVQYRSIRILAST